MTDIRRLQLTKSIWQTINTMLDCIQGVCKTEEEFEFYLEFLRTKFNRTIDELEED